MKRLNNEVQSKCGNCNNTVCNNHAKLICMYVCIIIIIIIIHYNNYNNGLESKYKQEAEAA